MMWEKLWQQSTCGNGGYGISIGNTAAKRVSNDNGYSKQARVETKSSNMRPHQYWQHNVEQCGKWLH